MRKQIALGVGTLLIAISLLGASLTLTSPLVASAEGAGGMMGGWDSMREMMSACASSMDSVMNQPEDR